MDRPNELYYFVIYYRGDPGILSVATLCDATSYEESDYAIASDKRFRVKSEAVEHCLYLAKKHDKTTKLDVQDLPKLE